MSSESKLLHGLVVAPFTPFRPNFSLNLDVIGSFVDYLKSVEITGVFVCGTTGEFSSLTIAERQQVVEAWMEVSRKTGLKVVVHVGDNCLSNAVELARHAVTVRADEQARCRIPSFRGVKFSNLDLIELQRCRMLDDVHLNLLFGCDAVLLAALSLGVDGAVGKYL